MQRTLGFFARTVGMLALACGLGLALAGFGPGYGHAAGNTWNDSFNDAKRILERTVYADHRVTLYCGYRFDERKNIDLPVSFYTPRHPQRARRMEWEHTVPTEHFGRFLPEWRDGHPQCVDNYGVPFRGRNCAQKVNMEFRFMQSDMYNLYPSVGAVNALRSNYQYAELPDLDASFGSCEMKIDDYDRRAEPPARAKGQVARAALYMDATYRLYKLSDKQRRLFEAWDRSYPVDAWECTRTRRIEQIQGNENRFVKAPCQKRGLW